MSVQIVEINCPGCGAPVALETTKCKYCSRPIVIKTFNDMNEFPPLMLNKYASSYKKQLQDNPDNIEMNMSIDMCYLKFKMYDEAYKSFAKAVEDNFEYSETYFYAAISLLKGKKAFLAPRTVIDKIEEYIQAAIMIEPRGIYYYFWAYIRYDHHFRKSYRMSPNYQELLTQAKQRGLTQMDIAELYKILEVQRPDVL